jgi:steroid delta-isomerase-like uncharacterized protein
MRTAPTTTPEQNKTNTRRLIDEVWNKGHMAIADELIADNYVHHDPASPDFGQGPKAVKQSVVLYRTAFPNLHLAIEEMICEGDRVVTRWKSTGTHNGDLQGIAPTGKNVTVSGITITRFAKGKIAEEWVNWDALGLMKQLGVMPKQ